MSNFPTAKEVLEGAAEVVQRDGWCQHTMTDVEGRVCLMGALVKSAKMGCPGFYEAASLVAIAIGNEGTIGIPHWNDDPARSAEDVILLLKQVAARAA